MLTIYFVDINTMARVLTSILVLYSVTIVMCLPAKRSPFPWRSSDLESARRLPGRLQEYDRNRDRALDRKELTEYFIETFDDNDHISQNVEEVFYVLDINEDGLINVSG